MSKFFVILVSLVIGLSQVFSAERAIKLTKRYLNIPVNYDFDDQSSLEFVVDGESVVWIDCSLSEDVGFWVFQDVSAYKGKTLIIQTERQDKQKALEKIYQSNKRKYMKGLYKEPYRPQLHFSTQRGWINDPNGLVYYDGEFHLFFQHYPHGYFWGQPNWGNAKSKDLVHWEQLPDAIVRHEHGGIYSGSSVIDYENTSAFKNGENDVMVAFYTTTRFANGRYGSTQNAAYSNDRGRTFTDYDGNPVIGDRFDVWKTDNMRDPKVIWHESTQKWVMIVYEAIGHSIFTSDDLKEWEFQSHIQTFWECPELFELPVDGDPDDMRWVMYDVTGDYVIGDFDGKTYTPVLGKFNYLQGKFFAAQTFTNVPESDGRRIQVGYCEIPGWVEIPEPNPAFNGMMSFPTELTLRSTANGVRMFNEPVKEIEKLYTNTHSWTDLTLDQANEVLENVTADLLHVKCQVENITAIAYSIIFGEDVLYYTLKPNYFYYNHEAEDAEKFKIKYVPELGNNTISYEFIVDRTSLEVFVDEGAFTMILPRQFDQERMGMRFGAGDGGQIYNDLKINYLEVHELKSIWE